MTFFTSDPFRGSLLARSGLFRLALVCLMALCLWLAIAWAVALP